MAALRLRFVTQARGEAERIAQHVREGAWDDVRNICHGLAGRAAMFGFGPLGEVARQIEEAIETGDDMAGLRGRVAVLLDAMARLPQAA